MRRLSGEQKERKTYYIETYGCQMNLYDADLLAGILDRSGYLQAEKPDEAHVVLVNTCSVRDHAERRALGRIRDLGGLKKKNQKLHLVVCGCMAQRLGDELFRMVPSVDLVVGTGSYRNLPQLLDRSLNGHVTDVSHCGQETYSHVMPRHQKAVTGFVAVMRGCDNSCTYCIVPRLRGPARSRSLQEVLEEVMQLVNKDCRQVTFLGQNVNVYRDGRFRFSDLLRRANEIPDLQRIRFVTSHPQDMDEEILKAMAEAEKVCEHLHLPVQSGSDSILRAMRRGYTSGEYRALVSRARQLLPGLSITTDIIAGFPGETDVDFQETMRLMQEIEFDDAFTFQYSPRPGTTAARMADQVSPQVRQNRLEQLIGLQRKITYRLNKRLVGHTIEVLVEGQSKRNDQELFGRNRIHKAVVFPGPTDLVGKMVHVEVKRLRGGTAWGERVSTDRVSTKRISRKKQTEVA